jgi:hypothetical protein
MNCYKDGLLISCNGGKYFYKNNVLHRMNGPAITDSWKIEYWYYNGCFIFCHNQEQFQKTIMRILFK